MVLQSELDVDDLMPLERLLQIHHDRTGSARARAIMEAPDKAFGEWRKVKPRGAAEPVALIRRAWRQTLQALIDADRDAQPKVMQRG